MTFTGRIRVYLVLAAVIPPLLVMSVIYFHAAAQAERTDRMAAAQAISEFVGFDLRFRNELKRRVEALVATPSLQHAVLLIESGRTKQVDISPHLAAVDFVEIVDRDRRVLATGHRPGLLGETLRQTDDPGLLDSVAVMETVEYDIDGAHAALACLVGIDDNLFLYAGRYLENEYLATAAVLLGGEVDIRFAADSATVFDGMDKGKLYTRNDSLLALLSGGSDAGFYLTAHFIPVSTRPVFISLLRVTGVVALVSIVSAILVGLYLTSRAKREIDNLVSATSRVAKGDFNTPVMAYEEGEFSQLADSFSDMMVKLKALQAKLGTAEKIAAWQAMGRKLAHEVKNPLTPMSISIDDLRQSYHGKLPEFDRVLDETTGTVKREITRLTKLLDQFVRFARMNPPVILDVRPRRITERISSLYRSEIDSGRLVITEAGRRDTYAVDPEQIQQLLVNLIKNGLESAENATVELKIHDSDSDVVVTVEDSGPGFPEEVLEGGFQPYLSKKEGGFGLGLVICQRIVHDHGGDIVIYNRTQGGAGVRVTLPLKNG
jgi:signal transduction histidine kinase